MYFTHFNFSIKIRLFVSYIFQSISCFFFLTYRKVVIISAILVIGIILQGKENKNTSKKVSCHKGGEN